MAKLIDTRPVDVQIRELEKVWIERLLQNDLVGLSEMQTDDFVLVSHFGTFLPKSDVIHLMKRRDLVFSEIQPKALNVNVYYASAVALGSWTIRMTFCGHPFVGTTAYSGFWVYVDGEWKSACVHSTDSRLRSTWSKYTGKPI